uniref:Uncharacterized protein n=1 Tax=Arundo donax TaxID=35708 RepID=A0A0A9BMF4_ARUDO
MNKIDMVPVRQNSKVQSLLYQYGTVALLVTIVFRFTEFE